MAKRFIDTEMFADEWFSELSKDGKLFFIYFITRCDHAGLLKLNKKLCEFQTGLKSIETVIKELGNCLVTVTEGLYFMPKFIKFQYPNFPNSSVRQQVSAINLLRLNNLWDEKLNTYLTVSKELPNSYVNDTVNDNDTEHEKYRYADFLNFLNTALSKNFSEEKSKPKFEALVKAGKTKEQFEKVILSAKNDEYHKETGHKYLTPEFLTRPDKFDKFLNTSNIAALKKHDPNPITNPQFVR